MNVGNGPLGVAARQRTSALRRLMSTRGIACTLRTRVDGVTTVTVYSKADAHRAEKALGGERAATIRIEVRQDA